MRKKIAVIMRGYKLLYSFIPGYLPLSGVMAVFGAVIPFINIFASAMIINALTLERDLKHVIIIAVCAGAINFGAKAVMQLLTRITQHWGYKISLMYEKPLNEKQQQMDYAQIEDPETRYMRQMIYSYRNVSSHGILRISWLFERTVENLLTVVFSIGAFAPALAGTGGTGGAWGFIGTSWFAGLLLLLLLGNAVFSVILTSKRTKKGYEVRSGFNAPRTIVDFLMAGLLNKYGMGKDLKVNSMGDCFKSLALLLLGGGDASASIIKLFSLEARYDSLKNIASGFVSAAVYIFVAIKTLLGSFAVGGVVQYVGGMTRFNTGFTGLATNIAELFANVDALNVYFDFLDKPDKVYHGTIPVEKRSDNEFEIEFRGVGFKYPGMEVYALKNLNLTLNIGQRMAVVGMNGSGKTTMIKLLCRLYDPTEGEITLNGIDIRKYDYKEYMGLFSVVFQDFKLFSFPLGQNVAASMEYDADRVLDSLRKAGLAGRVAAMPNGLETSLYRDFDEKGVEISGGEAQKIAIARALYKEAPFIVLDEPTAALDPIAEFEVYSKFNDIVDGKTAIFISHRLSSCRFCQNIAVFHEGELIQRGSHDELIADEDGKYFELWHAQAQYYVS